MRLQIFGIDNFLEVNSGEVVILNVKPQELYLNMVLSLLNKIPFEDQNDITISDDEKRLKLKDLLFVSDIFTFDIDNKAIITKISKELLNYLNADIDIKEEYIRTGNQLLQLLDRYLSSFDLDYEIVSELDLNGLLKLANVNFVNEEDNSIAIIDHIAHIYKRLFGIKYFIFRNLVSFVSLNDFIQLEDIAKMYQISIILLENTNFIGVVTNKILTIENDFSSYLTVKG